MKRLHAVRIILRSCLAVLLSALSAPLLAAITLQPVVSTLTDPIFAGHAGDSTNRMFIVEQAGIIKVLQPGTSTPTVFLDISSKVLDGGERGLLGLAFHPSYETNGRFFVFYTADNPGSPFDDGTIVVAEYRASPAGSNTAGTTETVLLTIPHPAGNHNGGMLAFGPDGFLYIGVGDGGGSNDADNNAQNIESLLGKLLRINVDVAAGGLPYSSPADNPYVGTAGRDEIFSIGWRNPWRFSFDRQTNQMWVADVGQGAREEVDTPIVKGGNYGWRIMEGSVCNPFYPVPCTPPTNSIPPLFDYTHSNNRCSITGGYVYRGAGGAVPPGTYLYADYCTGEIFQWNGTPVSLLLDTGLNISSFGEDQSGELYVLGLGAGNGSLSRIVSTTPPCTYSINPTSQSAPSAGGTGTVGVTAGAGCGWTAVANASWLRITSGASGSGPGNVDYSADANTGAARSGTLTIAGQTFTVNQSAAATCTYTLSPPRQDVSNAGGGPFTLTITASTGCPWTATTNVNWIHLPIPLPSGNGNGMVTYSIDPYTGKPKKRSGTITVAGRTLVITQTK